MILAPINPKFSDKQLVALTHKINPAGHCCDDREQSRIQKLFGSPAEIDLSIQTQHDAISAKQPIALDADRPCNLILTSGSSGSPKAVCHCYANHYFSAKGAAKTIPLNNADRWLLSLPLFHIGGLAIVYRCLLAGATIVLPRNGETISSAIQSHRVTHVSMVNTQFRRLIECIDAGNQFTSLRYLLLGGSNIDNHLLQRAYQTRLKCFTSYGMTEMTSQICTCEAKSNNQVGMPLPYRQLQVTEDGEILVKGETLALGYWDKDGVRPIVDDAGWFHTKDIGRWYYDGSSPALQITGRKDNQFISGGENVQPEQIEEALLLHPDIQAAIVVPVSSEEYGQRPVAYITLLPEGINRKELNKFLSERLARYQIPDHYLPLPENPENTIKPDRRALQKLAEKMCRQRLFLVR